MVPELAPLMLFPETKFIYYIRTEIDKAIYERLDKKMIHVRNTSIILQSPSPESAVFVSGNLL